jgi:hypothetical protein
MSNHVGRAGITQLFPKDNNVTERREKLILKRSRDHFPKKGKRKERSPLIPEQF